MTKFYKKILPIVTLICVSNLGFGQFNEIKIRFIGNCGLHLTDGKSNLYVDFPYKPGAYGYMEYGNTEIDNIQGNSAFLFTHRHADHYSKKLLNQIKNKHKGNVFGSWNTKKIGTLSHLIDDFKIETCKTRHRFSFSHYSYLITWHGKRIFLSGDTENAETIATAKDIDWAFVPPWIMLDAKEKNIKIDSEKIGIYHLYPDQKINNLTPEKISILDKQGEAIIIPY